MKRLFGLLCLIIMIGGGIQIIINNTDWLDFEETRTETDHQTGLNNPASTYCLDNGGISQQYGVCYFEDNRQCEEWALFHGDCPVGGIKVTGYENDAEAYCAISGGELSGVGTPTPMCKRVDGTRCNAQANFEGKCPSPYDPNPDAGNGPDV